MPLVKSKARQGESKLDGTTCIFTELWCVVASYYMDIICCFWNQSQRERGTLNSQWSQEVSSDNPSYFVREFE